MIVEIERRRRNEALELVKEVFLEFESLEQFLEEPEDYLEYYNTVRIKEKLNGMSPVLYRTHNHRS
jgi:transposase InsO family protein